MSGIWVAGEWRKGKRVPRDQFSGTTARRVKANKGTPNQFSVWALADNVGRHEVVSGLAIQARHANIVYIFYQHSLNSEKKHGIGIETDSIFQLPFSTQYTNPLSCVLTSDRKAVVSDMISIRLMIYRCHCN